MHNGEIRDSSHVNHLFRDRLSSKLLETGRFYTFSAMPPSPHDRRGRFGGDLGGIAAETSWRHGDERFSGCFAATTTTRTSAWG
jgi:hypothetical protein